MVPQRSHPFHRRSRPLLRAGLLLSLPLGLHLSLLPGLFAGAIGASGAAASIESSGSPEEETADWAETPLGSVPNRFGELFAVTQQSEAISLLFRNSDRELRLLEKTGNTLRLEALVVTRLPEDAGAPKIGTKRTSEEGWTEIHAANIPPHFGSVVGAHGNRREGGVHLIFEAEDGDLRVIRWNATGFDPEVRRHARSSSDPSRSDGTHFRGPQPGDALAGTRSPARREPSSWTEVREGVLPRWLGRLVTTSSRNQRFLFCFESSLGDLQIVETQAGRRAVQNVQILRSPLDKEGRDLRRKEIEERARDGGNPWKTQLLRTFIPEEFGEVVGASGIPAVLHLRDAAGTDRFVTVNEEIRRSFETIPRDPDAKGSRKEAGWSRVDIGYVPASFGRLRAVTSDPDNPKRHLYLYQSDGGVLHLVDRVGPKLRESSLRIDREY